MSTPSLSPAAIRAWRLGAQLSQEAVAALLGVHRTTVVAWEAGRNEPSDLIAAQLADLMQQKPTRGRVRPVQAASRQDRSPDWAEGVRHAVSSVMRTLADLIDEAHAVPAADADDERVRAAAGLEQALSAMPPAPPAHQASAPSKRRRGAG